MRGKLFQFAGDDSPCALLAIALEQKLMEVYAMEAISLTVRTC